MAEHDPVPRPRRASSPHSRSKARRAWLAPALALVAGCGSSSQPTVSDADRQYGAEQHPQLLAEFGGPYAQEEAAYVAQVGERVAQAAGLGDQCTFTLVNSDVVNAFAVPGCYIYITRGLMGIVNSEAELASVLAHEVGHIAGAHSAQQQRRSVWRSLGVFAVGALTGSARLSELAGAAANFFTLRYSRKHEHEADDLGLNYLVEAGYDPYAAADMLGALQRQQEFLAAARGTEDAKSIPEWALTHPHTDSRIARTREAARKTGLGPDELPEREAEFLSHVDGLLYGDDPQQGFVLGRRFAHPVMRIGFEAPAGFSLTNSPQSILLSGPNGTRGQFGGGPLGPEGIEGYARALFAHMLGETAAEIGPARRLTINGVPALVAQALVQAQKGTAALSVAIYEGPDGQAYHFIVASKPEPAAQTAAGQLFQSFHLLSAAEAAQLRPRFIRTHRIGAGETLQSLAAQMASERPAEAFLMLNGRSRSDAVRPGEVIKLVVQPAG